MQQSTSFVLVHSDAIMFEFVFHEICIIMLSASTISRCDAHWNLSLNHTRSITFKINTDSVQHCQRTSMVEQILDASPKPKLSSLVMAWMDFRHCSRKYHNLKYVHLLLSGIYIQCEPCFDIDRLDELVPHLSVLKTSDAVLMLNEHLIEFTLVLDLISWYI
ncbi:unnamed protein product [Adineta ricciae]|uniref:Uncharacterized protein n=1 Tax=Adineta ricciae TaxID=249248 RepID=A0A814ZXC1_ADIRI|nr:unnamed protein product [Adineta ricciae]